MTAWFPPQQVGAAFAPERSQGRGARADALLPNAAGACTGGNQRRDSAVFLVADRGGQVVGEGIALIRQHKSRGGRQAPPSGRVYSLAVRNDCRGQQIGRRLVEAMLEQLAARGVRRVYLEVEQDNARAIRLYEQHGFRWIGYLPDYYGPGRTGSHMLCELTAPVAVPAPA